MADQKPPIRVPLASPFETRDWTAATGVINKDSYLINCYKETQEDGRVFAVKRQGLVSAFNYNAGGATNGQGTAFWKAAIYAMGSNVLYNLSGAGNASASGAAWTASTSAPWQGRRNFGCIVFNGQILVMGGESAVGAFNYLNDVWSSQDGVNWVQLTSAATWAKRTEFGVVVLGNTLFLMGGLGGAGTTLYNDVWSTVDGVNWTQVVGTAPWSARHAFMVQFFNNGITLAGGLDASAYQQDVWFTPDGATWTKLVVAAGWAIRAYASSLVYAGKFWVAGGINGGGLLQDVWSSVDGVNWTNTGNLPAIRDAMATCVYANKMWFIGGSSGANTTTVWSSTDGITFTVVTATYGGTALSAASAIPFRAPTTVSATNVMTMWLIGGFVGATFSNQIYRATINLAIGSSYTPTGTGAATTEQWQSETQNAGDFLIWKNSKDAWILNAGAFYKITDPNYPPVTVPGIVNLDDTLYVMDPNGVIYGSRLSTPTVWPANNFITADYEADTAICLVKYQNYVVALKSTSTQFFYDAGRFPGSPLLPAINYNARVGCVSALSVVNFNNTVIWAARTEEYGPYIVALDGFTPAKISTPDIDRILAGWFPQTGDFAFAARLNGHYQYFLSLSFFNITLVYDFTEKEWHIEQNAAGTGIRNICNYVTDGQFDYFQDIALGILYQSTPVFYQDNGVTFTCSGQTVLVDGGTNSRKFTGRHTLIGDRYAPASPNNVTISFTNDDSQTYTTLGTVDLTAARPVISRGGSFYRRRYKWTHASNNPMRLEAIEVEVQ